jgi:cytochrome c oxidase accessory protein FixG
VVRLRLPAERVPEEWIRPIERLFEGDAGARRRRDSGRWTVDRAWRKAAKWSTYAALAVLLAGTVVSYFSGAVPLWTGSAGPVDYALVGIFASGLFLDWAWFREQLCNFLCPYARFQGALTDDHSLVITYDVKRGEPRGHGRESATAGRCIECRKCVDVCPAGIDIRDGFQLECIACARCVDACTDVMGHLGHPTLVRYSTAAADAGQRTRIFRRRTVVYAGLLVGLLSLLVTRVASHEPIEVTVGRAPGSLFTIDADGHVRNTFLVRVANNDPQEHHLYVVSVHGLDHAELSARPLELAPLDAGTIALSVRLDPERTDRTTPFVVRVDEVGGDHHIDVPATFKAPLGAEERG